MTPLYWPTHITLASSSTIMSHYPGVTVLVRFSLFNVFVCLFVGICLVCLCVLLFVCLICLCVCIILFCIAVCIWAYGQNTINHLKSEV